MSHDFPKAFRVPHDGSFRWAKAPTHPPADAPAHATCEDRLDEQVRHLDKLERVLYACNRHSLLLIFQAMDAAGKDSTIRAVLRGVNPAGCQVFSFKAPSTEELDHDFLWRTTRCLPERGRIGVFNRSYYEEVLIVRVHPHLLNAQALPKPSKPESIWAERFESIRDYEKHLARNGTVILKFWLNVSHAEQRRRFLERIEDPRKNWKFAEADVQERRYWRDYMRAYEEALNATSRPWAPWYAIPADNKPFMRLCVAETIVKTLKRLDLKYPRVGKAARRRFDNMRKLLERD